MARRQDQKAITAKMYRRFAVITLMATAALAMASDDGNADKLNAEIEAQEAAIAAAGKDVKNKNQASVIKRSSNKPPPAASGWGSDEGGSDGGSGGGVSTSYVPQPAAAATANASVSDTKLRQMNLTRHQFMALPPQAQQRMLAQLNGGSAPYLPPAQAARAEQASSAASLARSGFEGPCSDC